MRVVVLSAGTGEVVWDHTNALFRQMRGWALRGMLCEEICCAQYFSIILLVHQSFLYDMAYLGDYTDNDVLTVYMIRRGIADPTAANLQQATIALRHNDRVGLWEVLSQGIQMRVLVPMSNGMELVNPLVLAIQSRQGESVRREQALPNTILFFFCSRRCAASSP